jgi:hypothetical protein
MWSLKVHHWTSAWPTSKQFPSHQPIVFNIMFTFTHMQFAISFCCVNIKQNWDFLLEFKQRNPNFLPQSAYLAPKFKVLKFKHYLLKGFKMKDGVFLKESCWIISDEITGQICHLKIRFLLSLVRSTRKTYCLYLWLQLYSISSSFHPDKLPGLKRRWISDPFTLPLDTHGAISHCLAL